MAFFEGLHLFLPSAGPGLVLVWSGAGVFVANGVSPLSRKEKVRILNERIDALLAESTQMGIEVETLIRFIQQRRQRFVEPGDQS